jgi:hypothetical protein
LGSITPLGRYPMRMPEGGSTTTPDPQALVRWRTGHNRDRIRNLRHRVVVSIVWIKRNKRAASPALRSLRTTLKHLTRHYELPLGRVYRMRKMIDRSLEGVRGAGCVSTRLEDLAEFQPRGACTRRILGPALQRFGK